MSEESERDQIEMFPDFEGPEPDPPFYSPYQDLAETRCPLCRVRYVYDRNGMARHPRGAGIKCRGLAR